MACGISSHVAALSGRNFAKKIFDSERFNNTSGSDLKVLDTALQNKIGELLILRGHD